jgi:hypothetical protein
MDYFFKERMSVNFITKQSTPVSQTCDNPGCGKLVEVMVRCSRCVAAIYCGRKCKAADWKNHKISCLSSLESRKYDEIGKTSKISDFSERDLTVLGYSTHQVRQLNYCFKNLWEKPLSKATLSGQEFTLLEAGEREGLREWMFGSTESSLLKEDFQKLLDRWGYEPVLSPEEGDFVLYFGKKDLTHMGRYIGDGLVRSKLGSASSCSCIHTVASIFTLYGTEVIYYRKNPQREGKFNVVNAPKFMGY